MDTFEARQLLTVSPFLQGTVFADSNGNGALDTTEAPVANAEVDLYASSGAKVATTFTGADGGYAFTGGNVPGGLTIGATYKLVESAAGYASTGAQALSTIDPAAVTAANAIQVTVVDPNSITASFTGPDSYGSPPFNGIYYSLNGNAGSDNPTQLFFNLSGAQALNATSVESLCVGVGDHLSFNTPFSTVVDPQGAMPNGGQIAYLFNHYATSSVNNPATPFPAAAQGLSAKNIASGLQVAIWKLEYGGAYQLTGAEAGYTTAQDYSDIQTAAAAFIADSTGKSEKMAILDASLTGTIPTPTATAGGQSILASMSYNFGVRPIPLGSLSGRVYADGNNNGSLDGGEAGIGGVPITLTQTTNGTTTTVATATTNADGSYSFANLAPGTYTVVEGTVAGYLPDSTNTGSLGGVAVTAGANTPNNNFGEILPGAITGFVYADTNNNGTKDSTEKGIGGVPVALTQTVNGVTTTVATATTNADGSYSFTNLAPGTYTVVEGKLTGYLPDATNAGALAGITVAQGATSANNNFGEILPGSLSGFVYADANNNGTKDGGETGIGGVTVTLTSSAGSKVAPLTVMTKADGSYSFANLAPGTYTVTEGAVAGYLPDSTNTGALTGVAVTAGANTPNNNFGEILPGSLSGVVYADGNNNGTRDSGETGIGSVPVTLTQTVNGKTVTVASTTTNADGSYSFANLAPGTYTVTEGAVAGYLPDATNTGALAGVTVTQGANTPNNNFGEILPGSIAGVVYADKTGDGLSADDTALAGVTVQLVNSAGVVVATQKSGSDGSYSFTGLAPGTYTVQEVVPTGSVQTGPGSLIYTVPLAQGQNVAGDNFDNYQVNCGCCPIGGISYTDVGPGGVSTFSGLGGNTHQGDQVTVNFTVGGSAPVTVTFVTYTAPSNFDLTKQAIFSVDTETLAPGQHSLTVTIPNSYYQIDFVCGGAISSFNPAANVTYHGEGRFIDADHGGSEVAPVSFASLAGTVFVDNNYDGKIGAGDTGLGGVTVQLTGKDNNGQTVSLTRITGKDGSYNFAGLQPGVYKVSEVTPGGYFTTKDSVGTVNGATAGTLASPTADQITAITLAGGNSGVNYNFGEQAVGPALGGNQTASTCFWNSSSGQNLIRSLNGGASATNLGNWLASTLPNSLSGLAGKTNAQVAACFQSAYSQCKSSPLTEGLATALAVYATDSGLAGGNYAACYGFKVTAAGAGAATYCVGNTFACYGGPTGNVTLLQLLKFVDANAGSGDNWFWYRVACVFDQINGCGSC